jgi:hypothetical protein
MPAAERQQETGMAWPASSSPRNRCRPSPCTGLSPGSEYYGGSAPPQATQPTTNLARPPRRTRGSRAGPGRFPMFTAIRSPQEEPVRAVVRASPKRRAPGATAEPPV